jgi:hypothetical protein
MTCATTPPPDGGTSHLGVAQLESEPWRATADAGLLIDEIDRWRAGRGR